MFRRTVIWILAILLGLFFVFVGYSKIFGLSSITWAARLSHWGYPPASRYVIGGVEILAGFALILPSLRRWAAIVLLVVMAGALVTHLIHGEFLRLLPPLLLGALLSVVIVSRSRGKVLHGAGTG